MLVQFILILVKLIKTKVVMTELENNPNKIGLISALSAVEICNTMTVGVSIDI